MDDLHNVNWISVPNAPYIMKYLFYDSGYHIIFSNLTSMYAEKLEETNILQRFSALNPFAQMKLQVILENLKKSLEKCVTQETELSINLTSDQLLFSLEFSAGLVLCKYNFEMSLLPASKITENIIAPTIFNALLSYKKILELQKKLTVYESTKSALISNTSFSVQDPIDPDWLKGKNVSSKNLLDAFLKIQGCFKNLQAENFEAHNAIKKEKSKNDQPVQGTSANKKFKLQENLDGETSSIIFQDNDEKIPIKQEENLCSNNSNLQLKSSVKRKKGFKI